MPVVRTDGRAGGRSVYGHVITKFSRLGKLLHFLTHGAPLGRFARESSAIKVFLFTFTTKRREWVCSSNYGADILDNFPFVNLTKW